MVFNGPAYSPIRNAGTCPISLNLFEMLVDRLAAGREIHRLSDGTVAAGRLAASVLTCLCYTGWRSPEKRLSRQVNNRNSEDERGAFKIRQVFVSLKCIHWIQWIFCTDDLPPPLTPAFLALSKNLSPASGIVIG